MSLTQILGKRGRFEIGSYGYSGKNKALTARFLGIALNTLRRKLKHYRVD